MSGSASPLKVGIVGAGTIGQILAAALDAGQPGAVLIAFADQEREKAEQFASGLRHPVPVVPLDELILRSDLIVEAASQAALPEIVPKALASGKDMMLMSVGGLMGHEDWFRQAEERGCRIFIPSGAIAGLDGLKSAAVGRLDSVMLTSRKPIAALRGTKYVVDQGIALDDLKEETVIFEGTPAEACRAFPTTSNVAGALYLAVGGSAKVCIRVAAVPGGSKNVHEIEAQGEFGRLHMVVENLPSANPRTSQLAAFSALATLNRITQKVNVGT